MLGHTEIIIIAGVVLVLFGSTAIPKFFRALGNARREFDSGAAEALTTDSSTTGTNASTEAVERDRKEP